MPQSQQVDSRVEEDVINIPNQKKKKKSICRKFCKTLRNGWGKNKKMEMAKYMNKQFLGGETSG